MGDPATIPVILNPAASGGAGARLQPRVEEALRRRGIPFSLLRTRAPGHARELASEAAVRGERRLLVVGGDGTIHEVANGVLNGAQDPPAIGVVPVGTGNDFFRMVARSRELEHALDALEQGRILRFDVGRARYNGKSRYFVNLLGVGVDVVVLHKRETFRRLSGLPQYLAALASALLTFRPEPIRVSVERESDSVPAELIEERAILLAATVGPSVGGGFMLNPEASPEDGLLDLFLARAMGPWKIARYVPRVIRGTHHGIADIRLRRFTRATVDRSDGEPFYFELDGERMAEAVSRLEIDVCPNQLPVLLPRRGR